MSDYLSKKAVLNRAKSRIEWFRNRSEEWQKQGVASKQKEMYEASIALEEFVSEIESGAFDADESEGTWKATAEVLGRENAQMNSEIQRLRAVLEQARRNLLANAPKTALGHIVEALSTTTVQAERINAPEGDGNDA